MDLSLPTPGEARDPASIVARGTMGLRQKLAVGICAALNALDGFDVQSISFASPGIAKDWNIDQAALGVVLSMELFGMALGSIVIGAIADRYGRRSTIIGCLFVMAVGMLAAALSNDIIALAALRLVTGIGIGGMIACGMAMVAEVANESSKALCVAIVAAGYPAGGAAGGAIASAVLNSGSWHAVFFFGAFATAVMIPVVFFLLPESILFLARTSGEKALPRINAILKIMGKPPASYLADQVKGPEVPFVTLFRPDLVAITLFLSLAYFAHVVTFYFILKWVPKIVADMGFTPAAASSVLVWANTGGICGALFMGAMSKAFNLNKLVIGTLLLAGAMVAIFGNVDPNLLMISAIAGLAGFSIYAAIAGLYATFAISFPTEARASGTGFVIGLGRGGSVLGPIIPGVLFSLKFGLPFVALTMACGSVIAAAAIFALSIMRARQHPDLALQTRP